MAIEKRETWYAVAIDGCEAGIAFRYRERAESEASRLLRNDDSISVLTIDEITVVSFVEEKV